jgi:hypothetical protein
VDVVNDRNRSFSVDRFSNKYGLISVTEMMKLEKCGAGWIVSEK